MPQTASTRLGLVAPSGTDNLQLGDNQLQAMVSQLEARVARADQGIATARQAITPSAAWARGLFFETDTGITWWNTGSAWVAVNAAQPPLGTVMQYAGNVDPPSSSAGQVWMLLDGRQISRSTYAALFTLFGGLSSPYGLGNGSTTFNLPDGRGRVIAGLDNMGTAQGDAGRISVAGATLGAGAGAERVLLTAAQSGLPVHNHAATTPIEYTSLSFQLATPGTGINVLHTPGVPAASGTPAFVTSVGNAGGGDAAADHQNMQPTLFLNHIIRVL